MIGPSLCRAPSCVFVGAGRVPIWHGVEILAGAGNGVGMLNTSACLHLLYISSLAEPGINPSDPGWRVHVYVGTTGSHSVVCETCIPEYPEADTWYGKRYNQP